MIWIMKHALAHPDMLGFLPMFFSEHDERPAKEQINAKYGHGGGWQPVRGPFTLTERGLEYPGDPPMRLLFEAQLRDETLKFYEGEWLVVVQKDGSFEACRVD